MKNNELHTILDLLDRSCLKFPENPYLWEKRDGQYQSTTYRETEKNVKLVAAGLLAAGLQGGERVALLSEGCNDWVYAELGILYAGGVNVPLSIKLTADEVLFRVNHSEARFLVVSSYYLHIIQKLDVELPYVEKIFVLDAPSDRDVKYRSFEKLKEQGAAYLSHSSEKLEKRKASISADDVANISYTSGTTADPKGIMLTHGNYVCNVLQSDSLIQIPEHYKVLLFLPWDHSFAHTVGIYSFMYNGASLASIDFGKSPMEYLRNIPVNLKEVKPHLLLSVPALAKNFRKNIEAGVRQKGWLVGRLYHWGLKLGYRYHGAGNYKSKGSKILLLPLVKLMDALIFKKIRAVFGGNLHYFIGGGALLDVELQRYYCALGVPMLQGYGLSEASPVISSNTSTAYCFASSGHIVESLELKICDEDGNIQPAGEKGEMVIRGGNVMKGYWKNEASTADVLRDGWLYTGDIGYVSKEGFLYVLGRFKSLLIAEDGEKYSPEGIEESIVELSPYIESCVLYNNQCTYTSCLIVPNKLACLNYLEEEGMKAESIEGCKLILTKIGGEILKYRKGGTFEGLFPERWLPAVMGVLPETFSEQKATINSTMKVVRWKVYELYQENLEFMYTPEGKDIRNHKNTMNIQKLLHS